LVWMMFWGKRKTLAGEKEGSILAYNIRVVLGNVLPRQGEEVDSTSLGEGGARGFLLIISQEIERKSGFCDSGNIR